MVRIGLKVALAKNDVRINADAELEVGPSIPPSGYSSATFMLNSDTFHYGVRLHTMYPHLQGLCGFYGNNSNLSPGYPPSLTPTFNFVWTQERDLSLRSTTISLGTEINPGIMVVGAMDLEGALKLNPNSWSIGAYYGLLPFTWLTMVYTSQSKLGLGAKRFLSPNGLCLTAAALFDSGTLGTDKCRIGFEF